MTNHPRRLGRRKQQRQEASAWTDLTPHVQGFDRLMVAPVGTPLPRTFR